MSLEDVKTLIQRCSYGHVTSDVLQEHFTTVYFMMGVVAGLMENFPEIFKATHEQLEGKYYTYYEDLNSPVDIIETAPYVSLARSLAKLDIKTYKIPTSTPDSKIDVPRTQQQWAMANAIMCSMWITNPNISLVAYDELIASAEFVKKMSLRPTFATNGYLKGFQHRMYFVTHYVYIKSCYGLKKYQNDTVKNWIITWYLLLKPTHTKKRKRGKSKYRWKNNIEIFNELCICWMILEADHKLLPSDFLQHLRGPYRNNWLNETKTPFLRKYYLNAKQRGFEDLHTHLTALHAIALAYHVKLFKSD